MKNLKGTFILLLAAFIWGTAFVAQTSAGDNIGAFTFNACRNIIGALFLFVVIAILDMRKYSDRNDNLGENNYNIDKKNYIINKKNYLTNAKKWPIKEGVICGILLCIAMNLQQIGINTYPDGVAVSGRAGFLTATYVVMIAIASVFMGQKLHKLTIIAAFMCIAGMYLLCIAGGIDEIYVADILELMCAVAFTIHMFTVDKYDKADGVKLSCIQFLTSGILSGILMLIFDKADINSVIKAIIPILYAGVMSSGIAYTLQIIGQKYAKPSVTAIVLSLESVFAALAGWILLGEHLSTRELTGCILVFTAVIIAQIPQFAYNVDDSKQQVIE